MKVFNDVGLVAIGSGVLLFLLTPIIKKWMHGIK
jgi:POT family proton-dependent oligopeptide transporter